MGFQVGTPSPVNPAVHSTLQQENWADRRGSEPVRVAHGSDLGARPPAVRLGFPPTTANARNTSAVASADYKSIPRPTSATTLARQSVPVITGAATLQQPPTTVKHRTTQVGSYQVVSGAARNHGAASLPQFSRPASLSATSYDHTAMNAAWSAVGSSQGHGWGQMVPYAPQQRGISGAQCYESGTRGPLWNPTPQGILVLRRR